MIKKHFLFAGLLVLLNSVVPCFAGYNRQGIPDSSEIRKKLVDTWFTAPVDEVRARTTELHANNIGTVFQVRVEETNSDLIVIVAPREKLQVDVYAESGKYTTALDVYPADIPGSWVLYRDRNSGNPLQVRYYFAGDSDVYIRFRPSGTKTLADFILFGAYAAKGVPVGVPFERMYSASFSEIQSLTGNTLPWEYTDIVPGLYHPVLQMIAVVRENLPRFFDVDDAAYNEDGNPVFISTGKSRTVNDEVLDVDGLSFSSAGFLKWIVDGLVIPLAGSYTKIEPLMMPTLEFRSGSFSDVASNTYNLTFSLDWTRNLAAAALSVFSGRNYYYYNSGCDVVLEPFASEQGSGGWVNSLGYLKNTGYRIDTLKPLLYVLAVSEPGRFYLGAIRQTDSSRPDEPEVHFFTESAAFFPYFDSTGKFNVVVFENGKELTLDAFMKKYEGSYVHLERINASERFFPQ